MKETKFNKKELATFKEIIKSKIKGEKKSLKSIQKLRKDHKKYKANLVLKRDKSSSAIQNGEMLKNMRNRSERTIRKLDDALLRIKNKTYGICRKTGKMISKRRLLVQPQATTRVKK